MKTEVSKGGSGGNEWDARVITTLSAQGRYKSKKELLEKCERLL